MPERSNINPIPEGESAYQPIGTFSFGALAKVHDLVACRRCGAAVPEQVPYQDQHDTFHFAVDKLYEWALTQEGASP